MQVDAAAFTCFMTCIYKRFTLSPSHQYVSVVVVVVVVV